MNETRLTQAVAKLDEWIAANPNRVLEKEAALSKWGAYFRQSDLNQITADGIREFLTFKGNKHWGHIQRHSEIYADMPRFRECLAILLNESISIERRLDSILPSGGPPFIKGLGRAVLTPILMCAYPGKYGVFNIRSIEVLEWLQAYREPEGQSFGKTYASVNDACSVIAKAINRPLPLVDLMFGLLYRRATDALPPGLESKNPDWAFTPEFEGPKKKYRVLGTIEAVNHHGTVVNKLYAELKAMGFSPYRTKAIDLFLADEFNTITHVFEVKTDQRSTSLYEAIGQAMWHGALQASCPKRILVLPGDLAQGGKARLERLAIEVLRYDWDASKPTFKNLKTLVSPSSRSRAERPSC